MGKAAGYAAAREVAVVWTVVIVGLCTWLLRRPLWAVAGATIRGIAAAFLIMAIIGGLTAALLIPHEELSRRAAVTEPQPSAPLRL